MLVCMSRPRDRPGLSSPAALPLPNPHTRNTGPQVRVHEQTKGPSRAVKSDSSTNIAQDTSLHVRLHQQTNEPSRAVKSDSPTHLAQNTSLHFRVHEQTNGASSKAHPHPPTPISSPLPHLLLLQRQRDTLMQSK